MPPSLGWQRRRCLLALGGNGDDASWPWMAMETVPPGLGWQLRRCHPALDGNGDGAYMPWMATETVPPGLGWQRRRCLPGLTSRNQIIHVTPVAMGLSLIDNIQRDSKSALTLQEFIKQTKVRYIHSQLVSSSSTIKLTQLRRCWLPSQHITLHRPDLRPAVSLLLRL